MSITFGGVQCEDVGVQVQFRPTQTHALRQVEMQSVPGKNGQYIIDHSAFDNYTQTYECFYEADRQGGSEINPLTTGVLNPTYGKQRISSTGPIRYWSTFCSWQTYLLLSGPRPVSLVMDQTFEYDIIVRGLNTSGTCKLCLILANSEKLLVLSETEPRDPKFIDLSIGYSFDTTDSTIHGEFTITASQASGYTYFLFAMYFPTQHQNATYAPDGASIGQTVGGMQYYSYMWWLMPKDQQRAMLENNPNDSLADELRSHGLHITYRKGSGRWMLDNGLELYDVYGYGCRVRFDSYIKNVNWDGDAFSSAGAEVAEWLLGVKGYARLEDTYEPDVYRMARFVGPLEIENLETQVGIFKLSFDCKPQKFLKVDDDGIIDLTGSTIVYNPTGMISKPLIKIKRADTSQSATLTMGAYTVDVAADYTHDYIGIDCETMNSYYNAENCSKYVTIRKDNKIALEYPVLKPGATTISCTNAEKLEIYPRWWRI